MHVVPALALALLFPALAAAQNSTDTCVTVVDDFSVVRDFTSPSGDYHPLNVLGGEWGFWPPQIPHIDVEKKTLSIRTEISTEINEEHGSFNLGTVPTYNYFYFQLSDQRINPGYTCYDLSPYSALVFDAVAPAELDFNITLTQHFSDCGTLRAPDSIYLPFKQFYKGDNALQHVVIPFADFATNLDGGPTDLVHLKDFTFINFHPAGLNFTMSNVALVKVGCPLESTAGGAAPGSSTSGAGTSPTRTGGATSAPTPSTSTARPASTTPANSGAGSLASGALGAVVAAVAGLLVL